MTRFNGIIGYGDSVETPAGSGIWKDVITEKTYRGDVVRNTRALEQGEQVNDDINIANSISVVADEFITEHFHNIKYVKWAGVYWTVKTVQVLHPRLILSIGGVYNGPKATP